MDASPEDLPKRCVLSIAETGEAPLASGCVDISVELRWARVQSSQSLSQVEIQECPEITTGLHGEAGPVVATSAAQAPNQGARPCDWKLRKILLHLHRRPPNQGLAGELS
jgi:hypothetical protein